MHQGKVTRVFLGAQSEPTGRPNKSKLSRGAWQETKGGPLVTGRSCLKASGHAVKVLRVPPKTSTGGCERKRKVYIPVEYKARTPAQEPRTFICTIAGPIPFTFFRQLRASEAFTCTIRAYYSDVCMCDCGAQS